MGHAGRARARACTAVVAALVTGGCGEPTAPEDVSFSFYTQVVFGFPSLVTEARVADDHSVVVTGIVRTRHTGYTVLGELDSSGQRALLMSVFATQTSNGLNFPTQNYYAGTIQGLTTGQYNLQVRHIIDHDRTDTVVALRQTVTVR